MTMNQNGQESEDHRKERVMYQHGKKVADKARHQVQDPIVGRSSEFDAQDVMCCMLYMHRQTVAQMASEVGPVIDEINDLEDEDKKKAREALAKQLEEIKSSLGPSNGNKDDS